MVTTQRGKIRSVDEHWSKYVDGLTSGGAFTDPFAPNDRGSVVTAFSTARREHRWFGRLLVRTRGFGQVPLEVLILPIGEDVTWLVAPVRIPARDNENADVAHVLRLHAVSRQVSRLAHDLGNMAAAIRFSLEALDSPTHQIRTVISMADQAGMLVERLQGLGEEISAGMVGVQLRDVISTACEIGRSFAGDNNTIECDLPDGTIFIAGDAVIWCQIIINIIKNATEADKEGNIKIFVRNEAPVFDEACAYTSLGRRLLGPSLWICIEDNSGGVAPEVIERIADPYYSSKTVFGAARRGLGYASLIELVERGAAYAKLSSCRGIGLSVAIQAPLAEG